MKNEQLPSFSLHRFPGKIGRPDDFQVFERNGETWVRGQKEQSHQRGLTFLELDENLSRAVHASFYGQCKTTYINKELSPGFKMQRTSGLYRELIHAEKRKVTPKEEWSKPVLCGAHHKLVPWVDMPLRKVEEEIANILATPCDIVGQGEASSWPPDMDGPSDAFMMCVARAFRSLSEREQEDVDIRVLAALEYVNICALDKAWEDLLLDLLLVEFALYALEVYDPPDSDSDAGFRSDCFVVMNQLRVEVQKGTKAQPSTELHTEALAEVGCFIAQATVLPIA